MKRLVLAAAILLVAAEAQAIPLPWWVCVKTKVNGANDGQPPAYKTAVISSGYANELDATTSATNISVSGLNWIDARGRKHFTNAGNLDDVYVEAFNYETGQVCREPVAGKSASAGPSR